MDQVIYSRGHRFGSPPSECVQCGTPWGRILRDMSHGGAQTCTGAGGGHVNTSGESLQVNVVPLVFVLAQDESGTARALQQRGYAFALATDNATSDVTMLMRCDAVLVTRPLEHWYTQQVLRAAKEADVTVYLSLDTLCAAVRI